MAEYVNTWESARGACFSLPTGVGRRAAMESGGSKLAISTDPDRMDVWVPDKVQGDIAGYVLREDGAESVCALATGHTVTVPTEVLSEMNPPKFDKAADIADLTHLNEASVVHNLRQRFFSNMIYVRGEAARADTDLLGALPGRSEPVSRVADLHGEHD